MRCQDSSCSIFKIHCSLLRERAPHLQLSPESIGGTPVGLVVPFLGFRHFALWLYTGSILELGQKNDHPCAWWEKGWSGWVWFWDVAELLDAHAVGRKLQCVDFSDTIIDAVIAKFLAGCPDSFMEVADFVQALVKDMRIGSIRPQLAIDLLIYHDPIKDTEIELGFCELDELKPPTFIKALAREIIVAKGNGMPQNVDSDVFGMMIATGFLEAKYRNKDHIVAGPPWTDSTCEHHQHTEVGLPCYRTKA